MSDTGCRRDGCWVSNQCQDPSNCEVDLRQRIQRLTLSADDKAALRDLREYVIPPWVDPATLSAHIHRGLDVLDRLLGEEPK